jgi:phosphoribosylformylglycinamidine cyclo-ligase
VTNDPIRYQDAGVDIEAGDRFAASISSLARGTRRPEVLADLGGFAGLFSIKRPDMEDPVLVSGTDGVGTKLLVAQQADCHTSIGIDLVAMCVNDVLTVGAEPLFFLDYFATGHLEPDTGRKVLEGIAAGCTEAGCALLGGETAEMPGMYQAGHYDLAGFCVGIVDRPRLIDGSAITPGDCVIGVHSSGIHSNGYSLVRHVLFERNKFELADQPSPLAASLETVLLRPTHIYTRAVLPIVREGYVHGMAHVTGGGIAGNLARVLPENTRAVLDRSQWNEPAIFRLFRSLGVPPDEMDKTFNLGLGMLVVCSSSARDTVCEQIRSSGFACSVVGRVESGERGVTVLGETPA